MRRVQSVALGLFEAHGFDAVTIEAIAAKARTSPASIYRNFGTKERIVLWDEYDPMLLSALERTLGTRPLLDAVLRALSEAVAEIYDRDAKRILRRTRLVLGHPALMATSALDRHQLVQALSQRFVSSGACRNALQAGVAAGAVAATLEAAVTEWMLHDGKVPLEKLLRAAFRELGRLGG